MTYRLAPTLSLPSGAATMKYAVMGNSGSGKTYAAGVLVEEFLQPADPKHAVPVVVIDPVGVWYALRLNKRGTGASGLEIPVIGGMHAEVALPGELSPTPFGDDAGTVIGQTLAKTHSSAVLDVSLLSGQQQRRLVTDFAIAFFDTMARHRNPFHVVLDEAQLFLPEAAGGGDTRMIGALDKLTRLGRNHGIGHTLISQRPQSVRKASLNMANTLIAFQLPAKHERDAIKGWINNVGQQAGKLLDGLATLETGDGILWSPSWLKTITPIRTRPKRTYDASATPEFVTDASVALKPLKSGELIKALTNASPAEHTADPDTLKRRLRDKQRTIETLRSQLSELTPGRGHCFSALCGWSVSLPADPQRRSYRQGPRRTTGKLKKSIPNQADERRRAILHMLEHRGPLTIKQIARSLKLQSDSSHLRAQLRHLRDEGLVRKLDRSTYERCGGLEP